MNWRSRWVIVPTALVLVVAGWNLYVATHDGGVVEGRVVDPAGQAVGGAQVVMYARTFLTDDERAHTETGPDGRFRFTGNHDHALKLQATAGARGTSSRVQVRLLFRGENVDLGAPLVVHK